MYPLLFGTLSTYLLMWGAAALLCIGIGVQLGAKSGFERRRSALALLMLAVSVLVGSKVLYLVESALLPEADYVPLQIRGALHGFRIPGGMLALLASLPFVCGQIGLSWREFGAVEAPVSMLAVVFIRMGCILNGCCFGSVSHAPWAVAFPRGSWVYWYHQTHGWLPVDAAASLPVHPLQIYFLFAAIVSLLILLLTRRQNTPGRQILISTSLFFGTSAALEPLRANRLILNEFVVSIAALSSAALLIGRRGRGQF